MLRKSLILFICIAAVICSPGLWNAAAGIGALSSASAVLYEPDSKRVLHGKGADSPRPMASTTKIMTALLAIELSPLDRVITVPEQAVRVEGSSLGLSGGDRITMLDLVTGMLLESGNDAANAVAFAVAGSIEAFVRLMNRRAKEIGMKNTFFATPSGLDEDGHRSTAYDMALLAAEAIKNPVIAKICASKSALIVFGDPPRKVRVTNHNRLLHLYPHAVGMKTGFTKKSGRCLVSAAEKDGVRLIAVTLKAGDDWNDHIKMYEYGFSLVELVAFPAQDLPDLDVAGGRVNKVALKMDAPPSKVLLKEEKSKLRAELSLPKFLIAPVKSGETVGSVRYFAGDREICKADIKAAAEVTARPVAGFFERVLRRFAEFFRALARL